MSRRRQQKLMETIFAGVVPRGSCFDVDNLAVDVTLTVTGQYSGRSQTFTARSHCRRDLTAMRLC